MSPETPGIPPETNTEIPPDSGTTVVTPPASSGGKTAAELEAQYVGLQKSYQKMKETSDSKIVDATSKLQEATAQIEELKQGVSSKDSQMATLTKGVDTLKQQLATLQSEKSTIEAQYNRSKLVMTDYPELAIWEAQGLLPKGNTDEETKQLLTKFRETMTGQVGKSVKETMSGAIPPGSGQTNLGSAPGVGDESEEYVMSKLLETAGRDKKAYEEWQVKYDAILTKKASKTS